MNLADCLGLDPRATICVGAGYSREAVKDLFLKRGMGISGLAVTTPTEIAARAAGIAASRARPLAALGRQEILRALFSDRRIRSRFPELNRLRRRGRFWRRLDSALQGGRMAHAHADQADAFDRRLEELGAEGARRAELRAADSAYEAFLDARGLYDEARLFSLGAKALEALGARTPEAPDPTALESLRARAQASPSARLPWSRVYRLRLGEPRGIEARFWEALATRVELRVVDAAELALADTTKRARPEAAELAPAAAVELQLAAAVEPALTNAIAFPRAQGWEIWHSLDDAADALADSLAELPEAEWERQPILIPDEPSVRRSLVRALGRVGVPIADPRDPLQAKMSETLKTALLPLRMVAGAFERDSVIAWLEALRLPGFAEAIEEIQARGISRGVASYVGIEVAAREIERLGSRIPRSGGAREMAQGHLAALAEREGGGSLAATIEPHWLSFIEDCDEAETAELRAHALVWLSRLEERIADSPPGPSPLSPERGAPVFRLSEAPVRDAAIARLWVLGLPAGWLRDTQTGDLWYSARDRDRLAELGIRGSAEVATERRTALRAWLGLAEEAVFLDYTFDWDGSERESLGGLLTQVLGAAPEPTRQGMRMERAESTAPSLAEPPVEIRLGPRTGEPVAEARADGSRSDSVVEIRATALDAYSRCPFLALLQDRWAASDLEEPGFEPWPTSKGRLLHAAARRIAESGIPPRAALEEAWAETRPRGCLRGERIRAKAMERYARILDTFARREEEYRGRSGARILAQEGPELRLEAGGIAVRGRPDRIDEHPDGLFLMDYKTGSTMPRGREMAELGYASQLPFYAVAASRHFGRPAIGAAFVQLNREGRRTAGILFKRWNGKKPGCLSAAGPTSASLLDRDPGEVWAACFEAIERQAAGFAQGRFDAKPTLPADCKSCRAADACGYPRRLAAGGEEEE